MPAHSCTEITGLEPTYSAREAATLLTRSYSWLDQRVRNCEFTQPDGSVVQPLRSPGGYRYFTVETLRDIAACCYRHRWFSFEELKTVIRALALADDHGAADEGL